MNFNVMILDFWVKGLNTMQIANRMNVSEAIIYNRLAKIKKQLGN